ncbi:ArsR/SmtB family transcription factor [Xylanimonas ulmi]|uniref:ArsR family transcriptional regulator n=1 Tax=Xylanimonas ulmi TaxID=228973 RepID=A0A4Q7MAH9_9MICO|nr:helix-turn-helix domain-containing protein [Xylanibacterium ulmi]RZS63239.1 ArsR family transcriptional regulator [Xylanibacterium ulmi]
MADTMRVTTPEALRALAHPLRVKILLQLERDGHGRASDVAKALGEPPNSVSFHLRTLARAGLVVEAPELARDRRDRVWRNAAESYAVSPGTPGMELLTRGYASWFRRALTITPSEDGRPLTIRVAQSALSATQARELASQLQEVVDRWAREETTTGGDDGEPLEIYNVVVAVGPTDLAPNVREDGEDRAPGGR